MITLLKYFIMCRTVFSSDFVQSWWWYIVGGEWHSMVLAAKNNQKVFPGICTFNLLAPEFYI